MFDSAFSGLPVRRTVRRRLAEIADFIAKRETFRRADIMAAVEISEPQASMDLREIKKVLPDLFTYDASRKAFIVRRQGGGAAS